jgi:hypothetical protein
MNRIRAFFAPRHIWLGLLVSVISAVIVVADHQEAHVRWWGTLLQLFAICTVLRGLFGSVEVLNPDMFKFDPRAWWNAVWGGPTVGHATGDIRAPRFGVAATMRNRAKAPENATLEQRVDVLEKNVDSVEMDLGVVRRQLADEISAREQATTEEAAIRELGLGNLRKEVADVTTGTARLSLLGIFCLVLGVGLTGCSPELAQWFGDSPPCTHQK